MMTAEASAAVPQRWVEIFSLDYAFQMLELERMPDYGFTGATLWSSFESLDAYFYTLPVTYRKFAELNAVRDRSRVREGEAFFREFSRRAHHRGMTVMHGYHLCSFVGLPLGLAEQLRTHNPANGLRDVHPEWFNTHGEPDFSLPHFYDFMAAEVEDFFDTFPHVDGLYCWNCECSSYTPSRLKHQSVPIAEIIRRAIHTVYEICQLRGKTMTHDIHTAGGNKEQTAAIIAAAAECPDLILGADATYPDWSMHLPTTALLAEMARHNRIYVGFDGAGEFFGQGRTLGGHPRWLIKHFAESFKHKPVAISVRNNMIAKDNSCVVVPLLELNLRVIAQLALHGSVNLDDELRAWWPRHFSGNLPEDMKEIILSFEEWIEKALYINGVTITEFNPDHGFHRKAVNIAPGFPCWHSEQFTPPGTPMPRVMRSEQLPDWTQKSRPIAELRQEQLDAIAICDRALTKLPTLDMAAEDREYFIRRLRQARDFSHAFLLTVNIAYYLYQILAEHYDKTIADPRAALRAELEVFLAHADAMEERWGPRFYRNFTPKMREFAADAATALKES